MNKLLLGAALALPWLFIWQGLDVTDQGYLFTIYRCFLRNPEAVAHTSHMWLTNVVGAIWDLLFGSVGVVGQRALWAACTSVGLFAAFRAIRACSGEQAAALGVLVGSAFLSGRRETWFSYNTLTGLLSVLAATTLFHALRTRCWRTFALAGFFLGLSPFARLSNVLHASMLVAPLFAALLDRTRWSRLPRELGSAVAGYFGAIALALACMAALGHWSLFWQAGYDLLHPSAPSVNHSTGGILKQVVTEHLIALPIGALVVAAGAALVKFVPKLPPPAQAGGALVLSAAGAYGLTRPGSSPTFEAWTLFVIGPCYAFLGAVALGLLKRSFEERVACFIGLVALFITPIGSDNGLRAGYLGAWFALPLTVGVLYASGSEAQTTLRTLGLVVAGAVIGESIHRDLTYTYRDMPRPELWTSLKHPQLVGQLTNLARAAVMDEALQELERRVKPGDYLLAYDGTPLLQYLTRTRPYVGRPWLMTDDDPALVPGMLKGALAKSRCLPVAVRSLRSARTRDWPASRGQLEKKQAATRKAVSAFLKQNGYRATWRNSFFEILEPTREGSAPASCR